MTRFVRCCLPAAVGLISLALLSSCRVFGPAAAGSGVQPFRRSGAKGNTVSRIPYSAKSPAGSPLRNAKYATRSTPFASDTSLAERLKGVVEDAESRGVTRRVGVAVYDMATGEGAGLNVSHSFRPASVIKLAVLVAAYEARPRMSAAQFNRLRPDLERMITVSDNAATRRLVHRLGARSVNAAVRGLGLRQFTVGESGSREWVLKGSEAAPGDTAMLLAKIARREVVSREASNEMLALLGAQRLRERIPAGLPAAPGLWVGNKTGTLEGVVNDAGIVLEPSKGIAYTLAIFTSGTRSEAAGNQLLADISAVVYSYMTTRRRGG